MPISAMSRNNTWLPLGVSILKSWSAARLLRDLSVPQTTTSTFICFS